jgi:hypothetical protein
MAENLPDLGPRPIVAICRRDEAKGQQSQPQPHTFQLSAMISAERREALEGSVPVEIALHKPPS